MSTNDENGGGFAGSQLGCETGEPTDIGGDIAVGDVVSLRSGGPRMTVTKINRDSIAVAYSEGGEIIRDAFPAGCLVVAEHAS